MLRRLDLNIWPRRQIFQHFRQGPCPFKVTLSVDGTAFRPPLKERGLAFLPDLIYAIRVAVNCLPALRMGLRDGTRPAAWDAVLPLYTVFHPATETISALGTERGSFDEFLEYHRAHNLTSVPQPDYLPTPNAPPDLLNISMALWLGFSAFELNFHDGADQLLPVFMQGSREERAGQLLMPVASVPAMPPTTAFTSHSSFRSCSASWTISGGRQRRPGRSQPSTVTRRAPSSD